MITDTMLGFAGVCLSAVGLWATVWAARDARQQRSEREKAVITANAVIDRTYGLLMGLKPGIAPPGSPFERSINDGLDAINQCRSKIENL